MNLYIVPQGKFFGHESFIDNTLNPHPGMGVPDPNVEKLGMRALVDCSMYLLSESKILHLVSEWVRRVEQLGVVSDGRAFRRYNRLLRSFGASRHSSTVWLGLAATPVIHCRFDSDFPVFPQLYVCMYDMTSQKRASSRAK